MLIDGRRGRIERARGERRRALHRRNEADLHVDAVLLEDAGELGELQGLEAGPAAHAEHYFLLRLGRECDTHGEHDGEPFHLCLPTMDAPF